MNCSARTPPPSSGMLTELVRAVPATSAALPARGRTPAVSAPATPGAVPAALAAVNNRVRFDAAQSLTVAEQLQARTNIGAVAVSDVGKTDTDFVVIFDGALA